MEIVITGPVGKFSDIVGREVTVSIDGVTRRGFLKSVVMQDNNRKLVLAYEVNYTIEPRKPVRQERQADEREWGDRLMGLMPGEGDRKR